MIDLLTVYLIINSLFLTTLLVLTFIIIRAGSLFAYHLGDEPMQIPLKWTILRALVVMVIIGLIASLFNFIVRP